VAAAANLHATAVAIRAMPRRALIDVAKAAKADANRVGARYGAPLQGNKRRAMRMRTIDDIRDTATGANIRIQGVNVAAWVWMNTGTAPHQIRRRKRGPKAKMTVQHPGTGGKGAWREVAKRIETVVIPQVLRDQLAQAVGRG